MPVAAALYCRISKDAEQRGLGVARQEADCRALLERKGWTLADVYVDNDISATRKRGKVKQRPAYERMVHDIKNGKRDAVVAWEIDRLGRDPLEREQFFVLCELTGVEHIATPGDDVNIETGEGIFMARVKGDFAAEEARKMSKRLQRKHLELALAGKVSGGGVRPFGFESDRVTIKLDEAELLRDATRRILAGESLYSIVAEWTRRGVATATGVAWSTTSLKSTLVRARIAGLREHRGVIVGPAVWEAVIDRATWERLRAVLTNPARRRNPVVRSYLLTGILSCGKCGHVMVATPRHRKMGGGRRGVYRHEAGATQRAYGCVKANGGCGGVFGLAASIEELVSDALLLRLDSPEMRAAICNGPAYDEGAVVSIVADEVKLLDLADDYDEGRIEKAEWLHLRTKVQARIAESRKRMSQRPADVFAGVDLSQGLRAEWEAMSLDRKRSIITAVVEKVTLAPATGVRNRFDPSRVNVVWEA
jgi:DNA invertase Pin-like site-specific DNA recombinase